MLLALGALDSGRNDLDVICDLTRWEREKIDCWMCWCCRKVVAPHRCEDIRFVAAGTDPGNAAVCVFLNFDSSHSHVFPVHFQSVMHGAGGVIRSNRKQAIVGAYLLR